jgi:lipoate-protein ligase A
MNWTLLLHPAPRPGWYNMALDQALLDRAERTGRGFVRLYRWEPFCLSFGRHEAALRRYDRDAIRRLGLDTVRRPTGGRAVWHARELTYAVAAPVTWFGGLRATCLAIHSALAAAVSALGARAELAPRAQPVGPEAGACFALAAGGEVQVDGRKLAGSAQVRQGGAFLQHGSLLLEDDQRVVAEVTAGAAPVSGEITLAEALGRPVGFEEAAQAVLRAFQRWEGGWEEPAGFPADDLAAEHAGRFRDSAWTWRR